MTHFKAGSAFAICAACLGLALAGCGGGNQPADGTTHGAAIHAPRKVTIAFGTKPSTLDPDLVVSPSDIDAVNLIAGTLTNLHVNAAGDSVPTPGLASRFSVSANGLSQTYYLRPNLRFSNGDPLTAADVVATIDRGKNDKSNAQAGVYTPISSVTSPNPTTVVFKLTRPYPSLRTILGEAEFAILPAADLDPKKGTAKGNFLQRPISDGPYEIQSWGGGPTITFVPNPHYWGPKPAVSAVTFVTITDANTMVNELTSGQIDVATLLPPALIPRVQGLPGVHVDAVSMYGFSDLLMNDGAGPLANVRVRRAISLAINRGQISKTALFGKFPPLAGFWPSTMTGYDPSVPTGPNPGAARQLLAGTACAHGCSLQLMYETTDTPWSPQAAVIIKSNLAAVGITVHLAQLDVASLLSDVSTGKYQLSILGLYQYDNEPDTMVETGLLQSGGLNADFSGYKSPEMTKLAQYALRTDGNTRLAALRAIGSLFDKDQPYATLSDFPLVYASRLPQTVVAMGRSGFVSIGSQ